MSGTSATTTRPRVARTLQVLGTGHELPLSAVWRGTTARTDDGLVWHLYELEKR